MGQSNTEQDERHILSCGCRIELRDGRLLGFNRYCATAGALVKELMAAPSETRATAVEQQLQRHATT